VHWTSTYLQYSESAHRSITRSHQKISPLSAQRCAGIGARVLDSARFGRDAVHLARDYGIIGVGIDMSQLFTEQAKLRAEELGVANRVEFIHGDAVGYVANEKVGVQPVSVPRGSVVESSAPSSFWRRVSAPKESSSSANPTGCVTTDGRRCQGCLPILSPLSHASRTSRVFRRPRL